MDILGFTEDGRVIVILSEEEVNILKGGGDKPHEQLILPYEHVGQNAPGAYQNRNDCGAACVASCARANGFPNITVDEISAEYQRPNKPMYIWEVQKALRGYGLQNAHQGNLDATAVRTHLEKYKMPVIALVHYPSLPYQAINYRYGHYILIYGFEGDNVFYYHDPLSDGRVLLITSQQLNDALADSTMDGNKPNQGIVILS